MMDDMDFAQKRIDEYLDTPQEARKSPMSAIRENGEECHGGVEKIAQERRGQSASSHACIRCAESVWIPCAERLPKGGHVVIALYIGQWPGRGNGGIADLYCWDGEWFNKPDGVTVTHWVPMPKVPHA